MKRYLYIIIGIVVAAALAILVLIYIKDRSATSTTIGSTTTGSLPAVGTQTNPGSTSSTILALSPSSSSTTPPQPTAGSFGILSTSAVLDYFVDAQNNITAIQPTGAVITISNGQSSLINSSTISDIVSASFSYDGKKILLSFGDPSNPQAELFDVASKIWTTLPQCMQSPRWASSGYQIAFLASAGTGKESLSMINAAIPKSGVATLLTLHANDMALQWIGKTQFVLSDKPTSYVNGSAWLFNSQNDTLTPIISNQAGIETIWSSSTNPLGLIFSIDQSGQGQTLDLDTTSGAVVQKLSYLTLPSKCLFSTENTATSTTVTTSSQYLALYCGIPRSSSGFSSARLPDDYNMMALFTSDDIYKINTATGATDALFSDQTQNLDTSDLKIFNNTLFFINRYDQKLYGLVLAQ
jgi:hypothetical protein